MAAPFVNFDFDLSRPFGGGAYCDLFVGSDRTGNKFALKRPRARMATEKEQWHAFLDEARVWQTLSHRHVLPFLGAFITGQQMYLVSPFLDNGSLSAYAPTQSGAHKMRLLRETALGLAYLHEQTIVHGDLKGQNILVSSQGTAKLCDFGFSKIVDEFTSSPETGEKTGTADWASPELLNGEGRTFASDVYAFGMTICEILSDRRPFHNYPKVSQVVLAVTRNERPPQEPAFSSSGDSYAVLWVIARRCWDAQPNERPLMEDVVSDIPLPITSDIFEESVTPLTSSQSRSTARNASTSALHLAATQGNSAMVSRIVQRMKSRDQDIDLRDDHNCTALHLAAGLGHAETAKVLIEAGANVDAQGEREWTPLQMATRNGHPASAIILIESGADIHIRTPDNNASLIHLSVLSEDAATLKLLLQHVPTAINLPRDDMWTPLHLAIGINKAIMCSILLEKGADLEARTDRGWTPLYTAMVMQDDAVLAILDSEDAL